MGLSSSSLFFFFFSYYYSYYILYIIELILLVVVFAIIIIIVVVAAAAELIFKLKDYILVEIFTYKLKTLNNLLYGFFYQLYIYIYIWK